MIVVPAPSDLNWNESVWKTGLGTPGTGGTVGAPKPVNAPAPEKMRVTGLSGASVAMASKTRKNGPVARFTLALAISSLRTRMKNVSPGLALKAVKASLMRPESLSFAVATGWPWALYTSRRVSRRRRRLAVCVDWALTVTRLLYSVPAGATYL